MALTQSHPGCVSKQQHFVSTNRPLESKTQPPGCFCIIRNRIAQNKQWTCEAQSVLVLGVRVGIRGVDLGHGWIGTFWISGCAPLGVLQDSLFAPWLDRDSPKILGLLHARTRASIQGGS